MNDRIMNNVGIFLQWVGLLKRFGRNADGIRDIALTLLFARNHVQKVSSNMYTVKANDMKSFDEIAQFSQNKPYDDIPSIEKMKLIQTINKTASWLTVKEDLSKYEDCIFSNDRNYEYMMHWLLCFGYIFHNFDLSQGNTNHDCLQTVTDAIHEVYTVATPYLPTHQAMHLHNAQEQCISLHVYYQTFTFRQWFSHVRCPDTRDCKYCLNMESHL